MQINEQVELVLLKAAWGYTAELNTLAFNQARVYNTQ